MRRSSDHFTNDRKRGRKREKYREKQIRLPPSSLRGANLVIVHPILMISSKKWRRWRHGCGPLLLLLLSNESKFYCGSARINERREKKTGISTRWWVVRYLLLSSSPLRYINAVAYSLLLCRFTFTLKYYYWTLDIFRFAFAKEKKKKKWSETTTTTTGRVVWLSPDCLSQAKRLFICRSDWSQTYYRCEYKDEKNNGHISFTKRIKIAEKQLIAFRFRT